MTKKHLPETNEQYEYIAKTFGTPVWVTSEQIIIDRVQQMKNAFPNPKKILYAIKANYNPHIVKILKNNGIDGIDAVSPFEVQMALDCGFLPENIIFTGSNPSTDQIRWVHEQGILINAGSISELERFGSLFPNSRIAVRINPGIGAGLSEKTITGGALSKFGIPQSQFSTVKKIVDQYQLSLVGVHSHVGSGFYTTDEFITSVQIVLAEASFFPKLEFVDFGGGFGIPYRPESDHIDLEAFGNAVQKELETFAIHNGKPIEMRIEPGRFLPCESTVLLATATTRKEQPSKTFIGLDTGMHHLIRPAMYDAYHHISNISNTTQIVETVDMVGNVCESSDIFRRSVEIAPVREGDIIAIHDAGAYGSSMSSNYNMQPMATEVLVRKNGEIQCIKKRQTYEQMIENFGIF